MKRDVTAPIMGAWVFWQWQVITRGDAQPYLTRLIVFRCPWFALYLHWFEGSDDLCLHDHPWAFASLILRGGYWETIPNSRKWHGPGSLLARPAKWRHRVEIPPGRRALTLLLIGPKQRGWGFWTPKFGFIPWRKYHSAQHCA